MPLQRAYMFSCKILLFRFLTTEKPLMNHSFVVILVFSKIIFYIKSYLNIS
jgi:hypothetical protein